MNHSHITTVLNDLIDDMDREIQAETELVTLTPNMHILFKTTYFKGMVGEGIEVASATLISTALDEDRNWVESFRELSYEDLREIYRWVARQKNYYNKKFKVRFWAQVKYLSPEMHAARSEAAYHDAVSRVI